jgi:hypothetical protein
MSKNNKQDAKPDDNRCMVKLVDAILKGLSIFLLPTSAYFARTNRSNQQLHEARRSRAITYILAAKSFVKLSLQENNPI